MVVNMMLIDIYFRFEPMGLILEYCEKETTKRKVLDLSQPIEEGKDVKLVVENLLKTEELLTNEEPKVIWMVNRLREIHRANKKQRQDDKNHLYTPYTQRHVVAPHQSPLSRIAFVNSGDNRDTCVTGSFDGTCKLWNLKTGAEMCTFEKHENVVSCLATAATMDRDYLLSGSFDKTAKLWNLCTGECIQTFIGHSEEVLCVAFNQSHAKVATGSNDSTVKLWNAKTGRAIDTLSKHSRAVTSILFANYGIIITASLDLTIILWKPGTGILGTINASKAEIKTIRLNHRASIFAYGSLDGVCFIHAMRQPDEIMKDNKVDSGIAQARKGGILDIAFGKKDKQMATASMDGKARYYNLDGQIKLEHTMEGHKAPITQVCFNKPGTLLLTASADRTARVWNTETGSLKQVLKGHTDEIFSCGFSPNGDYIVTASKDNTIRIWWKQKI